MASVGQVRALGLALQVIAGVSLGTVLVSAVRTYVYARGEGEIASDLLKYQLPSIASVVLQLGAGIALSYGSRTAALVAALVYALAETALFIWLAAAIDLQPGALAGQLVQLAWPVAVLIAVARAGGGEPRHRAEAGGPLVAAGVGAVLWLSLVSYDLVAIAPVARPGNVLHVATQLAVGLFALRAGWRLVGGKPGRAVGVYAIAAGVIAAALFALDVVWAIGSAAAVEESSPTMRIAIAAVTNVATLAAPLLLWAYARPTSASALRGAPEPAAAARPLAWLSLWFGIEIAARAAAMVAFLILPRDVIEIGGASNRTILWAVVAAACALAAADVAVFFAARRRAHRRAMWAALLGGALAASGLGVSWYLRNTVNGQLWSSLGWVLSLQTALLLVLAWLHRPSARQERGLADVFE